MLKLTLVSTVVYFFAVSTAFANLVDRDDHTVDSKHNVEASTEVNILGKIQCLQGSHTSDHDHRLKFISEKTGETFDVENPNLADLHCKTDQTYRVNVIAEKSDAFLFWDGSLKVKSFKVISTINETFGHRLPKSRKSPSADSRL